MGIKLNISGSNNSLRQFISVIASGINYVKTTFSTFVNSKKLELKFNAQAIYLSEYLNQLFDPELKRIYIVNDATILETYLFRTSEVISILDQEYLFRTSEIIPDSDQLYLDKGGSLTGDGDFLVAVPAALISLVTDPYFAANINKYKLPNKNYVIITY